MKRTKSVTVTRPQTDELVNKVLTELKRTRMEFIESIRQKIARGELEISAEGIAKGLIRKAREGRL
jgi:anti-sigma28 factor (negative regulator of flagellin synthesis)